MPRGFISDYVQSPGPSSVSHYEGRFSDPAEWQRLNKLALQVGRMRGQNDFLKELIDKESARAKEASREEVKNEQAQDDESQSFWSKLGDASLEALTRTVDVLSRGAYASANTVLQAQKDNPEYVNQPSMFGIPIGLIPDDWDEVQNLGKAAWRGFSGKDKTVYSDVITKDDQLDGSKTNPFLKGLAGFTGDVLLDPTTYLGIGIIKQGVKGVKGLADEVAGGPVGKPGKPGLPAKIQAEKLPINEQERLIDHLANLGTIKHGDGVIKMDRDIAMAALGIRREARHAKEQGRRLSHAKRAEQVNTSLGLLKAIKERIAELPEEGAARAATVEALEKQARRLEEGIKSDDALKAALRDDYAEILDDMRRAGEYPDLPNSPVKTVREEFDDVVTMGKLTQIARERINLRFAENALKKHPRGSKEWRKANGEKKRAERTMARLMGNWYRSDELGDNFHETAWRIADETARSKNKSLSFEAESSIRAERRAAVEAGDQAQMGRVNAKMFHFNERLAEQQAMTYGMKLAEKLTHSRLMKDEKYASLHRTVEKLQDQIAKLANNTDEKNAGRLEELNRKLTDYMAQRDKRAVESGKTVKFRDIEESDVYKTEDGRTLTEEEVFEQAVKVEADEIYEQKIKTARRSNRSQVTSREIFEASGRKKNGKTPHVKIGDEFVDFSTFARTAKKKGLVTKQDHAKANRAMREQGMTEKHSYKVDDARPNEFAPNRDRSIGQKTPGRKAGQRVTSEDLGVRLSPEAMAFQRIFKEQHGMDIAQYYARLSGEEARQAAKKIDLGNGRQVTKEEFVGGFEGKPLRRHKHGNSDRIPWNNLKDGITRKEFIDGGLGTSKQFDEILKRTYDENRSLYNTLRRKQFDSVKPVVKAPVDAKERILTKSEKRKLRQEAREEAEQKIQAKLDAGESIVTKKPVFKPIHMSGTATRQVDDPDALFAKQKRLDAERRAMDIANERYQAALEGRKAQIDEINAIYRQRNIARQKARQELKAHQKLIEEKIDEQTIINLMANTIDAQTSVLRISLMGAKFLDIPSPQMLTRAVEKMSGRPLARSVQHHWAKAFQGSSHLEPELNLARLRMQSNTPAIIHHHVSRLKKDFGKYTPAQRRSALKMYRNGTKASYRDDLDQLTADFFEDFTKYFDGRLTVGGERISYQDLNRWLPEKYHIEPRRDETFLAIKNGQDLLNHMQKLRHDEDPLEVMWRLTIAGEQAQAVKGMQQTIGNTFGVKVTDENRDLAELLESRYGWEKSRDIPGDVIFDPEVKDQIARLHQLMGAHKGIDDVIRIYDKALGFWKSSVTVYNPGFYARNGIGEVIMSAIDGLSDPRYYKWAMQVMKYAKPDRASKEVEDVLNTMEPWKKYQSVAQKGGRPIIKLKGGRSVSTEEAWILYADNGLRSGFISSEFDTQVPMAGSFRATGAGQFASKVNNAVRERAENFEDYFRMAHFLYRMKKSGYSDPARAAEDAAGWVRKYHFDYSDFTVFEKTAMVRLFPFYKWTRKSLPLMLSMLFTQPGKAMIYPKFMQNLSYATGGTDPNKDPNGFNPNYENEVVPEWMRHAYSYPLFKDDDGDTTYFNVATPFFDAYKFAASPVHNAVQMFTPAAKVPIELTQGETLGSEFPTDDKTEYTMRQNPWGSLAATLMDKVNSGEDSPLSATVDPRTLSFFSGLGFFENTKSRQIGEVLRQVEESEPDKQSDIYKLLGWINRQKPDRE